MRRILTLLLTLSLAASAYAVTEDELLMPDQAFAISAGQVKDGKVPVRWNIADGYYLYRSKFRFSSDTPGVTLGEAEVPPGKVKQDPVFGKVETFRKEVVIQVPVKTSGSGIDAITLKARSQGCADLGVCYPPHTQTLVVALSGAADAPPPVDPAAIVELASDGSPSSATPPAPALELPKIERKPAADPAQELTALAQDLGLGGANDDIIPADQAFRVSASVAGPRLLRVVWKIADGTYVYRDKIQLSIEGDGVQLGAFELPQGKIKHNSVKPDGTIGDVPVFYKEIDLQLPLLRGKTDATEITLLAKYQGCADRGICYPPQKTRIKLALPAAQAADAAAPVAAEKAAPTPAVKAAPSADKPAAADAEPATEQDRIARLIAGGDLLLILGAFFLIGLGLAFTPCVFPMIPILSGIIAGQGSSITARKGFVLSLIYVLAMAVTYTAAGIFAALAGENLQALLQHPAALSVFALIFVLLALSMFGFYDLQLPASWQSKLSEISNKQQGGNLVGVAIMGLLSALIVGPCVAPPLAGALIYIGQTGDPYLGGAALFAMSMGMGAPLLVIGASAGKFLPKAGNWMDAVKAVFGVAMLGVAIYLLERLLPEAISLVLWGMLLVIAAVYLGALKQLPPEATGWSKLWKGLGVVLLIYGALYLVGAAAGGKHTLQPLRGITPAGGGAGAAEHVEFKRVTTVKELEALLADARSAGKPVLMDYWASWCIYCKTMELDVFPVVAARLKGFVLIQADVTEQTDDVKEIMSRYQVPAPPALVFWNAQGKELKHLRMVGNVTPEQLREQLSKVR